MSMPVFFHQSVQLLLAACMRELLLRPMLVRSGYKINAHYHVT